MTTQQIVEKLREIEAAHNNSVSTREDSNGRLHEYVDQDYRWIVVHGLEELREHFERLMGCTQWTQKEEQP